MVSKLLLFQVPESYYLVPETAVEQPQPISISAAVFLNDWLDQRGLLEKEKTLAAAEPDSTSAAPKRRNSAKKRQRRAEAAHAQDLHRLEEDFFLEVENEANVVTGQKRGGKGKGKKVNAHKGKK